MWISAGKGGDVWVGLGLSWTRRREGLILVL